MSGPSHPTPTTTFAEVSALTHAGGGRFRADISAQWTIGNKPNGGYLLAMMGRAAVAAGPHAHVLAASAHYLWAPEPGPADITAEVLRAGRSATQVRVGLSQGGRACVESLFT